MCFACEAARVMLRVFTYRRGVKVCAGCGEPLEGVRRDARAHPACAREARRRRGEQLSGSRARATLGVLREGGVRAAEGVCCPECGGDVLMVKVGGWATLTDDCHARHAHEFAISGRKMATCLRCEWRGTVAKARVAA